MRYDIHHMKKRILLILFSSFLLIVSKDVVHAQTSEGERIRSFGSDIAIHKDGTIEVKETIQYDFSTLQKHGIYRQIPTVKKNKDGKRYRLDLKISSVTDEDGVAYAYTKSTVGDDIKIRIGDANKTISGEHTYVITYKVGGALTYYSDHDEFYWNVNGTDWTVPVNSIEAAVTLPELTSQGSLNGTCFTGVSGSTASECSIQKENGKITVSATRTLGVRENITIVFGFPKGIVAQLEPKEIVSFFDTFIGKILTFAFFLIIILWFFLYPLWIPVKWYLKGRDPAPLSGGGEVRAWFDPPKTKKGRDLTPVETGSLIDEQVDARDISAMIVNLAQRGYFKIVEKKKDDFYFVKTKDPSDAKLLAFEKKLLEDLFDNNAEVRLKDKKMYSTMEDIKKTIYTDLVAERFFPENPQSIRTFYTVIGAFALFTFNFPLAFSAFIFGRNMVRKTEFGVESANIAKSLKNFLSSQERQLEFQAKNQMMFEKLLPFAVAFGVEKIWAERFKDIHLTPPEWYQGYDTATFNSILLTNHLNNSLNSFRSAYTPTTTSSSSGFSSGFSGGSSGGGGGGGGGGSW
ncbi:hypothetical protein COT62_01825 [Candidatus Roizmanbacteria bacterium CG09_land_8_20_14_0_10_41_9]|uniref:DUF2207 domain-containing protein n=1 Tax=Candidatus Roizmanbacteria bacterium CG09_land_8_20_14_0_10_41_9 TaxID=1974850 RepID=A0A2H0WT01_9BACT|nr:MAG: hypothetical protein COT62_01825 [Candidatus Roizmanbacteria bacterium CG09_land_8_20_14_0_10_41_9]